MYIPSDIVSRYHPGPLLGLGPGVFQCFIIASVTPLFLLHQVCSPYYDPRCRFAGPTPFAKSCLEKKGERRILMSSSKIIHGIVGASAAGLVAVHALPNLFPDQMVKRYAVPEVQVSGVVKSTFEDVAKKMDVENPGKVKLFINNGYGTLCVGSTQLPGGAAIGVSKTFLYNNLDELENAGVTFKGKKLNWRSKFGKSFSEVLLLGEDELKFVLAHELSHVKSWDFTTNCFLPAWCLYFTYRAIPIIVSALPPVNPLVKFTIQASLWAASYWIYVQENVSLHHKREFLADTSAAMVGLPYVNGGIAVTLKRMKMNTILRGLCGEEGTKRYSIEGNDLKDWAHPKLTERLRKLEDIYVEYYLTDAKL